MPRLHTYSQHFLRNPRLVAELIGHSPIKSRDTVYDIGAGSGIISSVLANKAAQVVAIEPEPKAAVLLRDNLRHVPNVTIIQDDVMNVEFPSTDFRVFANIPFHLSSVIVTKLTHLPHLPLSITLIVQRQFAEKMLPDSKRFSGQLGMVIGPWFDVKIRRRLHKTDFTPPPNVDTVLVELSPRVHPLVDAQDRGVYETMVKQCFDKVEKFRKLPLAEIGRMADTKPSMLTVYEWVRLFELSRARQSPKQSNTSSRRTPRRSSPR